MDLITGGIRAEGVEFSYSSSGGVASCVLDDVSFTIPSGQIAGLMGRNGSGKSTLLNVIRGTIVPQRGEVQIGGATVARHGVRYSRPHVALISQYPGASLAPTMTVYENWCLAHRLPALRWAYSRGSETICLERLRQPGIGLEDKLREQVRFLSAGQQQALSVLLGLELACRALLLDEPTASLDAIAAREVLRLATTHAKARGAAVLLVSQRPSDILEFCDRVLVLRSKRIDLDWNLREGAVTEQTLLESYSR